MIDCLRNRNCETQALIVTELGEPAYKKLGFIKISEYLGFETENSRQIRLDKNIRRIEHNDLEQIISLDSITNNENRSHLIKKYYKNGWIYKNPNGQIVGFYLPDFGRGLIISKDVAAGLRLLDLKHSKKGKRSMIPVENQKGIEYFRKSGLKIGYKCSRMILGVNYNWQPEYIFSYGSGYFG